MRKLSVCAILVLVFALICGVSFSGYDYGVNDTAEPAKPTEFSVITFNIRCFALESNPKNRWDNRSEELLEAIKVRDADLIGLQECTGLQYEFFVENLQEYGYSACFRDTGTKEEPGSLISYFQESEPIFYKKDRYELADEKFFWFSDTPSVPSKFSDSGSNRVATQLTFFDKYAQRNVIYINTHLDHKGKIAINESIKMLKKIAAEVEYPLIITGDFNLYENSNAYNTLFATDLYDAKHVAESSDSGCTYQNFSTKTEGLPIDFVCVTDDFSVSSYKIIREYIGEEPVSDHYGIKVVADYK